MNKIFTSVLALACAGMAYADSFNVTYDGAVLPVGETSIQIGYELQSLTPTLSLAKWEPGFYVESDHNTKVVVDLTSDNLDYASFVQDCTGGGCKDAPVKTTYDVEAGTPLHLEIHRLTQPLSAVTAQGDITGILKVYEEGNEARTVTLTINFMVKPASEVGALDNVAVGGDYVRLESGNSLSYNLSSATRLEVYSILGTRLVDRAVSGHGSVSLDFLGRGVYIYRAGRISGKIVVK